MENMPGNAVIREVFGRKVWRIREKSCLAIEYLLSFGGKPVESEKCLDANNTACDGDTCSNVSCAAFPDAHEADCVAAVIGLMLKGPIIFLIQVQTVIGKIAAIVMQRFLHPDERWKLDGTTMK